jgi:hypothetical protein
MPIIPKPKKRSIKKKQISFEWHDTKVDEVEPAVQLSVITKVPEKYILIDMETGQVFIGSNQNNPYDPNYKIWIEQKL